MHGASARASAVIVVNCAAGATRKVSSDDVFSTRSLLREATFPVSSKKSRPHDSARAYRGAHVHARACISAPHTCEVASSFNWRDRRLPFWISALARFPYFPIDSVRSKWVMQVGGGKTIVSYFSLFSVYLLDVYRRRIYFCIRMIYSYWNIGIVCSIRIYRWRNVAICNRVGNKVSRALRQTIIPGECTGES